MATYVIYTTYTDGMKVSAPFTGFANEAEAKTWIDREMKACSDIKEMQLYLADGKPLIQSTPLYHTENQLEKASMNTTKEYEIRAKYECSTIYTDTLSVPSLRIAKLYCENMLADDCRIVSIDLYKKHGKKAIKRFN